MHAETAVAVPPTTPMGQPDAAEELAAINRALAYLEEEVPLEDLLPTKAKRVRKPKAR